MKKLRDMLLKVNFKQTSLMQPFGLAQAENQMKKI